MLNACFLLSLITLLNMAGATPTPSPDHGVEYTMTITSPNLTLVNVRLLIEIKIHLQLFRFLNFTGQSVRVHVSRCSLP